MLKHQRAQRPLLPGNGSLFSIIFIGFHNVGLDLLVAFSVRSTFPVAFQRLSDGCWMLCFSSVHPMFFHDFHWFSMISTGFHMFGLAFRGPHCFLSSFFNPFYFSCGFSAAPRRCPDPIVLLWLSYICLRFSMISIGFHMVDLAVREPPPCTFSSFFLSA